MEYDYWNMVIHIESDRMSSPKKEKEKEKKVLKRIIQRNPGKNTTTNPWIALELTL